MKYNIIVACLMIFMSAQAQDCTKESLLKKPGTWKAGPQGSVRNISTTDLTKEKSVIASIHKMISTSYKPAGCQVSYSGVFGKYPGTGQTFIADPYRYAAHLLRYLCDANNADKSKYYVDTETPTTLNIAANVIYSMDNLYAANLPSDDFRGYLKLKLRPVKKDGYYFMGEEVVSNSHRENKVKEYRWLITYNDTLPFYYLSRKEYLLIQKKRLEKALQDSPGDRDYIGKFLNNINEYLKKPETELNKAAVCMWNDEERFEKFVEEGTQGSFIAVKPNLMYYRKNLPKSAPQFFSVVYKIAHGEPVYEENMANIQKAVDFEKLKALLGK